MSISETRAFKLRIALAAAAFAVGNSCLGAVLGRLGWHPARVGRSSRLERHLGQRRRHRFRAAATRRRLDLHLRLRRWRAGRRSRGTGSRRRRRSAPKYRPEFTARVADLDKRQVQEDPVLRCFAPGVPRIGPPDKIVQRAGEVVFLYEDVSGSFFRLVPTDGRPHPTNNEPSFLGDAVGHWEGDTLVVETVNFNDQTWLTDNGAFHTGDLRVVERLRRTADTLEWEATASRPGRAHGTVAGREARRAAHGPRDRRVAAVHRPFARAHGRRLAPHESALSVRNSGTRGRRSRRCRRESPALRSSSWFARG